MQKLNKKMNLYTSIIIVCLLMTPVSFSKNNYSGSNLIESGNLIRIFFAIISIGLVFIYYLHSRKSTLVLPNRTFRFVLLYWILGAFSFFKSYALSYSIFKFLEYSVLIAVMFYLYEISKKEEKIFDFAFDLTIKYTRVMLFIVLIGYLISPDKALFRSSYESGALNNALLPFQLRGWIIPLSNTTVCFFAGFNLYVSIVDFFDCKKDKLKYFYNCIIYFAIMIVSLSRMAFLGVGVAAIIYLLMFNKKTNFKLLIICLGILIIILANDIIFEFILRGQNLKEVASLTGRVKWWSYAINIFKNGSIWQKMFGFGFAAGEKVVARGSSALMNTLDSDYFANLISCGVIGFTCMLMAILSSIKTILRVKKRINVVEDFDIEKRYFFKASGIIIIILIRLFTVTSFSVLSFYLIMFCFSISLIDKIEKRIGENIDGKC